MRVAQILMGGSAIFLTAGIILSEWFRLGEGWVLLFSSGLGFVIGLTLFGAANLKARLFRTLNWVPLATGLSAFLSFIPFENFSQASIPWTYALFIVSFGSGWLVMGILLIGQKREQ